MFYINHNVSMLQVDKQKQSKGKGKPGETLEKVLPHLCLHCTIHYESIRLARGSWPAFESAPRTPGPGRR